MNDQKHTPGPWQAVKFDDEHDAVIIGPNGDERIAVLAGNEGNEPDCPNAHLIVAAPELLEALELLVGDKYQAVEHNPEDGARCFYCGGPLKVLWHEDSYLEHEMDCDFVKARAVLARVKGDAE